MVNVLGEQTRQMRPLSREKAMDLNNPDRVLTNER